ncbi:peptidase T-like protein [Cetobacterium ceti]|uniref:Peptidase T-like protein n=1 Tax=Cetobacterium ceti TaxID=180163 RepID=A0A1T4P961_9FUSO|nr:M20/M25/M40 family metallo-hydrolase [Cetobacterium ceti]SJZ88012.1 peptidase T-like protein [Cetobacterium ceti]
MNKERMINNFIEMVNIYSPSKKEGEYGNYLIKRLKAYGFEIYLDKNNHLYGGDCPTIFGKLKGNIPGNGITLVAHMDVIDPNENVNIVIENNIIKTDGKTTLGGDDKGGIASILEVIESIIENNYKHEDIYVVFTPGEEIGMAGAKVIDWEKIPKNIKPAKNMLVVDNAGKAGLIAHSAPSKYNFRVEFNGRKAHGGIEPEKGINSIILAGHFLSKIKIGRLDELTTSNIGEIKSDFPTNVVPDLCYLTGEVRGHSEESIQEVLNSYKNILEEIKICHGGDYKFEYICDFPTLKPKDNLKLAKDFKKIYESLGIHSELKVIGGGSDSNIFAKEGYNSIIIGVGMENVHTVEESLDINELEKTTLAILKYIIK